MSEQDTLVAHLCAAFPREAAQVYARLWLAQYAALGTQPPHIRRFGTAMAMRDSKPELAMQLTKLIGEFYGQASTQLTETGTSDTAYAPGGNPSGNPSAKSDKAQADSLPTHIHAFLTLLEQLQTELLQYGKDSEPVIAFVLKQREQLLQTQATPDLRELRKRAHEAYLALLDAIGPALADQVLSRALQGCDQSQPLLAFNPRRFL